MDNSSVRKRPRSRQCICRCKCDLTLFSFPQEDFKLHNIWLRNLGLSPDDVSHKTIKSRYCCSNHFEEHCFYPNIVKLKKGATPTILNCSVNQTFRANPKLKRSLTTAEREAVLEHAKIYPSSAELSKLFNCGRTQICNILKSATVTGPNSEFYQISRRQSDFSKGLGMIVNEWIVRTQAKNYIITNNTIKAVAERVSLILDIPQFRPSNRWLNRLIHKYKITNIIEDVPRNLDQIKQLIDVTALEDVIDNIKYYLPECVKNKIDNFDHFNNLTVTSSSINNNTLLYNQHDIKSYDNIDIPHTVTNNYDMDVYTISDSDDEQNNDFNLTSSSDDENSDDIQIIADISEVDALDIEIKEEKNLNEDLVNSDNDNIDDENQENILNNLKENIIEENLQNNMIESINTENIEDDIPMVKIPKLQTSNESKIGPEKNNEHILISSHLEAIEHLRPLEEFALMTSNYRAINFINNLEEIFKAELKTEVKKEL